MLPQHAWCFAAALAACVVVAPLCGAVCLHRACLGGTAPARAGGVGGPARDVQIHRPAVSARAASVPRVLLCPSHLSLDECSYAPPPHIAPSCPPSDCSIALRELSPPESVPALHMTANAQFSLSARPSERSSHILRPDISADKIGVVLWTDNAHGTGDVIKLAEGRRHVRVQILEARSGPGKAGRVPRLLWWPSCPEAPICRTISRAVRHPNLAACQRDSLRFKIDTLSRIGIEMR